jgi:hypothetical protein
MDDNAKAMALELAQDLDSELGGGVVAAIQDGSSTRAFGISEAAAAAGLIMSAVQIVMQYYSDKKMTALEAYLDEHLHKPSQITPAKRANIISKVKEKFSNLARKTS